MLGFVVLFGLFNEICPDYGDFQTPIRLKVIGITVSALHLKYLSDGSCVLLTQKNIHITLPNKTITYINDGSDMQIDTQVSHMNV